MSPDCRNIRTGNPIPSIYYADQPYITKTADNAWLCVLTTGLGREGAGGQHVVSTRSTDLGKSWSALIEIEPPSGPEASWVVPLAVPSGRIFVFYVYNSQNIRKLKAEDPPFAGGYTKRMDSFGEYVFKFSDDNGRSWSPERWTIPVREFEIDRKNPYRGEIRYFWNVGKPFTKDSTAFLPIHKVGGFGHGWFTSSEGALLKSENLYTEEDPDKISWETLPNGDIGLRTPVGGGPVAEEHSFTYLSDGTFFCVYRTIDGYPACAYSADRGHTWTAPEYMAYPDGRLMKHPRAANFAWRCSNGKFLYWFHNHGGRAIGRHPKNHTISYEDRNPVWLCGGREVETPAGRRIAWSQPEIALYDDDPYVRMSYPDLVEENGRVFLSETQKATARVHEIPPHFLNLLWQAEEKPVTAADPIIVYRREDSDDAFTLPVDELPRFTKRDNQASDYGTRDTRAGGSIEVAFQVDDPAQPRVFVDNRTKAGKGFALAMTNTGVVEVILNDGRSESRWSCDPDLIKANTLHHLVVIIDGGPKLILFVVDSILCDGGDFRQFGWGRYNPSLREVNGRDTIGVDRTVKLLRIYTRALTVAEAVGNFRHWLIECR
jgi:hypothetical protein